MDNKVNDIRRKIVILRQRMLDLQDAIRSEVNDNIDCARSSMRLMSMRVEMVALVRQRDALGGFEACPDISMRLKENHREPGKRVLQR